MYGNCGGVGLCGSLRQQSCRTGPCSVGPTHSLVLVWAGSCAGELRELGAGLDTWWDPQGGKQELRQPAATSHIPLLLLRAPGVGFLLTAAHILAVPGSLEVRRLRPLLGSTSKQRCDLELVT